MGASSSLLTLAEMPVMTKDGWRVDCGRCWRSCQRGAVVPFLIDRMVNTRASRALIGGIKRKACRPWRLSGRGRLDQR
jgi:hypothetical protein